VILYVYGIVETFPKLEKIACELFEEEISKRGSDVGFYFLVLNGNVSFARIVD
jgi:hypothetical protein